MLGVSKMEFDDEFEDPPPQVQGGGGQAQGGQAQGQPVIDGAAILQQVHILTTQNAELAAEITKIQATTSAPALSFEEFTKELTKAIKGRKDENLTNRFMDTSGIGKPRAFNNDQKGFVEFTDFTRQMVRGSTARRSGHEPDLGSG